MSSKRFKKLNADNNKKGDIFSKLISEIKKNCTVKFDESIDLSLQIYNKQKKNEINIRTSVNLPSGTGKTVKIAVVCEDANQNNAKDAGADIVGGDELIEKILELQDRNTKSFSKLYQDKALEKKGRGREQLSQDKRLKRAYLG